MKKILMLNLEFPPIGGGAANANYHFLNEMKEVEEFSIDFITSSATNKFQIDDFAENIKIYKLNVCKKNFSYWTIPEIILWTWKSFWFARNLLKEHKYDLLHCWFGWPPGLIGYCFRKEIPYIVALRGSDVPGYNIRLKLLDKLIFDKLSILIWKNAEAITANSKKLRDLAQKTWNGKEIKLIYNGIDFNKFIPKIKSRDQITILYVGRLISRKGVKYLLEAFREISRDNPKCLLHIAGDGPEKENLISFCKEEKIEDRISFLGEVSENKIAHIYQEADIFVLPSLEESLANAALEAMASGLPIITTNTGVSELINENGFIVEKANYKAIEEALRQYITNPDLIKNHGDKSRKIAQETSWYNNMLLHVDLYYELLTAKEKSHSVVYPVQA